MAMQVGEHDAGEDVPMSDINTTPLVDVMLVLLIIFLITVPVVLQTVPVKLPSVRFEPTQTKPENVNLSVRGGPGGTCEVYWNLTKVDNKELLEFLLIRRDRFRGPGELHEHVPSVAHEDGRDHVVLDIVKLVLQVAGGQTPPRN